MSLEDLTDVTAGDGPIDIDSYLEPLGDNKPQRKERRGEQQQSQDMAQYSPFMVRPNMTWDDRTMDRMITIKRPDTEDGIIWVTDADFAAALS